MKLICGLDKDKYQPELLILRDDGFDKNNSFPVHVDILNIGSISSPGSWIKLFRYFRSKKRNGFYIAHTFFCDSSLICPPILKVLGYNVLISRRDMGYWYTMPNLAWLKMNAFVVDRVTVNSAAVKSITMQREGYPDGKVSVIYNGYQDVGESSSVAVNHEQFREGELRVALVANIRPIKRIYDAIHAVKILSGEFQNIVLYVIGDGDYSQLEHLAGELGVKPVVRFIGPRDDVLKLMPMFDVGILCSESEGFSNTIIEYLQSGLPVVCSSVGGNPEIIENGVNGFLYEKGDFYALAESIAQLARDKDLRVKMGRTGREKVIKNYSLAKYIDRYQRIYEDLS